MNKIEPKLDPTTLPEHGQKVQWQTYNNLNNSQWKEGIYSAIDQQFCVGFSDTASDWDCAYTVLHWAKID